MTDKSNHISEGIHMFHTTHLSRRVYTLYIYLQHTLIDSGGQRKSKYMLVFGDHFHGEMGRKVLDVTFRNCQGLLLLIGIISNPNMDK